MILWQFGDAYQLLIVEINLATYLLGAIGEAQVRHLQHKVVAASLVHHFLRQGDGLFLAFYNDEWFHLVVVYHYVAPACHAVQGDGTFYLHQFNGVQQFLVQILDEVLPYPFLGCQCHKAVAHHVKDLAAAIGLSQFNRHSPTRCLLPPQLGVSV